MAFMEQEVVFGEWFIWEHKYGGTCSIPHEYINDVPGECILEVVEHRIEGWGARMSAPGYLDCTEWVVFETVEEAYEYLDEYYGEDDDNE